MAIGDFICGGGRGRGWRGLLNVLFLIWVVVTPAALCGKSLHYTVLISVPFVSIVVHIQKGTRNKPRNTGLEETVQHLEC